MKYTITTIQAGIEAVQLETDSFKAAQKVYLALKESNRGRLRINGGNILPIYKADKLMHAKREATLI